MAQTATIYVLTIDLADMDRGVYETVELKVARHPSETAEYMLTRVFAYCLEYEEGIALTDGVSSGDEPALVVRDLTGRLTAWIEVGMPDAARVHKAGKAAPRVSVYVHRDPLLLLQQWAGERIHRLEQLALFSIERSLMEDLVRRLERRMRFDLSVSGGVLYLNLGQETLSGALNRHPTSSG